MSVPPGPGGADVLDRGIDVWDVPDPLGSAGYDAAVRDRLARFVDEERRPGRIARIEYGGCHVVLDEGRRPAIAHLRRGAERPPDGRDTPLAVGDWVAVRTDDDGRHLVVAVADRHGRLGRRDPSRELCEQVLAANVDAVMVVHPLDRPLRPERIERATVLAHEGGLIPVIVAAKADLLSDAERDAACATLRARAGGAAVHAVDAKHGAGLEALLASLPRDATTALLGESGAGKSSLVNALHGRDVRAVGVVRARDGKGRHTTTARELVPLADGRQLLDTPGTRELGLVRDTGGLGAAFADVEALAPGCRFADCRHEGEDGCAVGAAVDAGALLEDRRRSYVDLRGEVEDLDERREQREQRIGEGRDRRAEEPRSRRGRR